MQNATITFPMLGEGFSICPKAYFQIFGHTFYWYGAIIAIGFLLAVLYCAKRAHIYGITTDDLIDMLIVAVPLGIVGARAYYVIFNFDLYRDNLIDVFKIWNGGLAIYGGVIGAVIGVFLVCRFKKVPTGAMLDASGLGLLIGQAVGRWGNFINREAYGGRTDVFCRMGLTNPETGVTVYVHPTFLYESLWNLLGLLLLHIFTKKCRRKYDGQVFLMYVGWYGLGRMFIEGMRTDSLYLFGTGIRVSQLLAGLSVLAVLIILFVNRSFRYHDEEDLWVNRKKAQQLCTVEGPAEPEEDDGEDDGEDAGEEKPEAVPSQGIIRSEMADEEIVDAPVVEPIEVVLRDGDESES